MKKFVEYVFWLLSRVNEPWYSWLNTLANHLTFLRSPERPVSCGPLNPDHTFYVIRDFPAHIGLAGWYDRVLGYLIRAESRGWTPVIDCAEWGDYFDAPSSFAMDEVRRSAHVVEAVNHAVVYKRVNHANIARRHALAQRVPMTPSVSRFCADIREKTLTGVSGPVIGVYFRGTDYRRTANWNAIGHATVPSSDNFHHALLAALRKWNLANPTIFLVTEEEAILQDFRRRFPSVRFIEKPRFTNFNFGVSLPQQTPSTISRHENNLLYLADLHILATCDYLVGTMNGGIQLALNWNGNAYRGVAIFDFGTNRPT